MGTLILTGEVDRDGKMLVELPGEVLPGPVEVRVRPLRNDGYNSKGHGAASIGTSAPAW